MELLLTNTLCSFSYKISAKKDFVAKLGIELTTTRGSTDRCFDHSATELVVNLQGSFEFYTNTKIQSHTSGSHGPLNEFEQVPLL